MKTPVNPSKYFIGSKYKDRLFCFANTRITIQIRIDDLFSSFYRCSICRQRLKMPLAVRAADELSSPVFPEAKTITGSVVIRSPFSPPFDIVNQLTFCAL